ncbi:hypothetical protein NECID01_0358 [Nematocida sp. AWRm77]|nr:hypothetical protein NECID01_0358 [Nematocida sp. AWRm77]
MKGFKKITTLISVYLGVVSAEICENKKYSVLQGSPDRVYVNPLQTRFWPNDTAGMSNMDSICPLGYTCIPNYIAPAKKLNIPSDIKMPVMRNKRHTAKAFNPINTPGGGCMGLEDYDEVGFQSAHNDLYLGGCNRCVPAKYKTLAMVFTSFNNIDSKWKLLNVDGKCAIKNVSSGYYLSRCDNCTADVKNTLLALFRSTIDENTNNEIWEVNRNHDGTYAFKSASTGEYLSICENCLSKSATISSPAALFTTEPDNSFAKWWIRVDSSKK